MNVGVISHPETTGGGSDLATSTPWASVLSVYLDTLDSPNTRRAYRWHIADALTAIDAPTLSDLSGQHLTTYRAAVVGSTSHSPSTQAQALAAVRSFLLWAGALGAHSLSSDVVRLALRTPRTDVRRPYVTLSDPEVTALVVAADTDRDRALLGVLLGAGVRVSECVDLDVSDLIEDADGGAALHVRRGKGSKSRVVPVQPEVSTAIRRYLSATSRRMGEPGPMFRAHDHAGKKRRRDRLTARSVGALVTRLAKRAHLDAKRVSPHSLRHTYAIRYLRNGGDLVHLSKLLGHASVITTQRYVDHLDLPELRAAVPHLPGIVAA